MSSLAARRRHPAALLVVLLIGLVMIGGLYAVFAPKDAGASAVANASVSADQVGQGKQLFLANCASCHGTAGAGGPNGPSLVGVGAAAVDFQVGTGRMPMQQPGVQAGRAKPQFNAADTAALSAFVASLGEGPSVPSSKYTEGGGNVAKGGELFRVNCAMCHNFAGSGGALTRGKYAPSLMGVSGRHMYEAMLTGPQSMPVFNDTNLSPQDKQDIISFLKYLESEPAQGGHTTGSLGPVADGLFAWTIFIGLLLGAAVWLGKKAA